MELNKEQKEKLSLIMQDRPIISNGFDDIRDMINVGLNNPVDVIWSLERYILQLEKRIECIILSNENKEKNFCGSIDKCSSKRNKNECISIRFCKLKIG